MDRRYDLAVCLEVAEHLPEASASKLVRQLTSAAPAVLFSAAVPGQGGTNHINEQWPDYWDGLFGRHKLIRLDPIRRQVWQDQRGAWYYQQNLFLYGTNGDKLYVSYRNRMGRKRSYMTTFEGIVPNLERRYKETDSDWSREKIEEYMSMRPCPECNGARLRHESRAVKVGGIPIHEFTHLSAKRAIEWMDQLELS